MIPGEGEALHSHMIGGLKLSPTPLDLLGGGGARGWVQLSTAGDKSSTHNETSIKTPG